MGMRHAVAAERTALALLVTRTLSKADSLAGFRVGYAILPEDLADDLNTHNDAYPLARSSQAAALATMEREGKIRERVSTLRARTERLAADLRGLGVRTLPRPAPPRWLLRSAAAGSRTAAA